MAKRKLIKNKSLFKKARRYLVGGVDSPVRSFNYVGGEPILIERGEGSRVYDYDGNSYIDYVFSWGSLILGHSYPGLIRDLQDKVKKGLSFGTTNERETELASVICQAIPFIDKIRFVSSGTEAVMGALRLARGYTGRNKIIKFKHSYHGHADYLLAESGSGLATLQIPLSAGVPQDFIKDTLVLPNGDSAALDKVFTKFGDKIAAVIFEPAGGNFGVIPPDPEFLIQLRKITKKHNTLLIADEIITGFRFQFGSLCEKIGIVPDLICLGKIIGGGLPVGAYAGRRVIMDKLAPLGNVYQASTFSGNPIVMQAGLTTLRGASKLKNKYVLLARYADYLTRVIRKESQSRKIETEVNNYGSMFSLKFKDKGNFRAFYHELLTQGVYLAPSEYEANFISFAHSRQDIQKTARAITKAFSILNHR